MSNFDIITGQPRPQHLSESRSTYGRSTDRLDVFNHLKKDDDKRFPLLRLGVAKDHKKDFYSNSSATEFTPAHKQQAPKGRLLNSVSTNYNIISHAKSSADQYSKSIAVHFY